MSTVTSIHPTWIIQQTLINMCTSTYITDIWCMQQYIFQYRITLKTWKRTEDPLNFFGIENVTSSGSRKIKALISNSRSGSSGAKPIFHKVLSEPQPTRLLSPALLGFPFLQKIKRDEGIIIKLTRIGSPSYRQGACTFACNFGFPIL